VKVQQLFLRTLLVVSVSATSLAAQAQVKYHFSMPDSVAAVAGEDSSGSFNAGVVTAKSEAYYNRVTGAWWMAGENGTKVGFAQSISASQGASTFGATTATNALSTTAVSPAPEPSTYLLLLAGLGLIGFVARRRQIR
jgi:hypothetical protein